MSKQSVTQLTKATADAAIRSRHAEDAHHQHMKGCPACLAEKPCAEGERLKRVRIEAYADERMAAIELEQAREERAAVVGR
jgi:hypothetical protein